MSLLREDYKDLFKLAMLYIRLQPRDDITLQRPGALYKARWMSKIIYAFKIVLLSKPKSYWRIIDTSCLVKPKRFVDFCIQCYISWCINCIVALEGPGNDLGLLHRLQVYKSTDRKWSKKTESKRKTLEKSSAWEANCSKMIPIYYFLSDCSWE